jgi:hypothetical protein
VKFLYLSVVLLSFVRALHNFHGLSLLGTWLILTIGLLGRDFFIAGSNLWDADFVMGVC